MTKPSRDFTDIDYLKYGNIRQSYAFDVLCDLDIMTNLRGFEPLLVGTIPIDIDLPTSDLDIICEFHDAVKFKELLIKQYGACENFMIKHKAIDRIERVVCSFTYRRLQFEIFGQPIPTRQQNGYRHMVIENRILELLGDEAKEFIIDLKSKGLKTEPAFGKMLNLERDPYTTLLEMYEWNEEQLKEYLKANSFDVV